jgi:YfiH family protein
MAFSGCCARTSPITGVDMSIQRLEVIAPDWQAPGRVTAAATTRAGGVSVGAYAGLNLGDHVGDDPQAVATNRGILREALSLPSEPRWLKQVHGCDVVDADDPGSCEADAVVATAPGRICAVLTADCLPVVLCDDRGERVAAVHAGWRGLADGVIEAAIERLALPPRRLLAWLGPAIGPDAFEIGDEVRTRLVAGLSGAADGAFRPSPGGRWLADLPGLARLRLTAAGVERVSGGTLCTFSDAKRFYSYRRDGATGRMATLVWIDGRR